MSTLEEVLFGEGDLSAEDEEYLEHLTTCELSKLSREPEVLRIDLERVEEEMKSTVVTDYKSFIQASQCIHSLHNSMENLSSSLKTLTASLQPLPITCNNFSNSAVSLQADREKNKLTLDKHDKMLELLKIPQLMEKRVKKGSNEEVLQMQQFTKQLARKHPNIPLINSIERDVQKQITQMRDLLHKNLRGNIKVHQCLENISYLRRLEVYSDVELRIIFLKSRDAWLQSLKSRLSTKNAYSYLSKLIDLTRDHLYEVITQYRILFSDNVDSGSGDGVGKSESTILSSWVVYQVDTFLEELKKFLVRVNEGSSLRNLMDLAVSVSRVGVDLTGFLPPLFECQVVKMFSTILENGTEIFLQSVKTEPILSAAKARNPLLMERRESFAPNRILLEVPPLAVLTNTYLHALNELRQCAIITISASLSKIVENQMEKLVDIIVTQKSLSRSARQSDFTQLAQITAEHFIPYVDKCFNHIFQTTTLLDTSSFITSLQAIYDNIATPSQQ